MSAGGFNSPRDRRRRLDDIHAVVASLRTDVAEAPDLTDSILARVSEERPFTDRRTRRLMILSRLGVAASIAVMLTGVALAYRFAPAATGWAAAPVPQPLSSVVDMAQNGATSGYQTIKATYQAVSEPGSVVQFRMMSPELAGKPGAPVLVGRVVSINRLGKVTTICSARSTACSSTPSASPAVVTAYCLKPLLNGRAYERVLAYAETVPSAAPAPVPALTDDFVPPIPGRPDELGALPR